MEVGDIDSMDVWIVMLMVMGLVLCVFALSPTPNVYLVYQECRSCSTSCSTSRSSAASSEGKMHSWSGKMGASAPLVGGILLPLIVSVGLIPPQNQRNCVAAGFAICGCIPSNVHGSFLASIFNAQSFAGSLKCQKGTSFSQVPTSWRAPERQRYHTDVEWCWKDCKGLCRSGFHHLISSPMVKTCQNASTSQVIPEPSEPCQIKQGLCCHKCKTRADCKLCLEWKDVTVSQWMTFSIIQLIRSNLIQQEKYGEMEKTWQNNREFLWNVSLPGAMGIFDGFP